MAMRIPAKITSSCIWVAIPVDLVILHWYDCGAHGRSLGRAVGVNGEMGGSESCILQMCDQ